jgi:hypothetical protein
VVKRPRVNKIEPLKLKHISNFKKQKYISDLEHVYYEIYSRLEDFTRSVMPNPTTFTESPRS